MNTAEITTSVPELRDCELCLSRLKESVETISGVNDVRVASQRAVLTVRFDPKLAERDAIEETIRAASARLARLYSHETLSLTGLDCADCATSLESAVAKLPGVLRSDVNFASSTMKLEYETDPSVRPAVLEAIHNLGYDVAAPGAKETRSEFRISGMDCADCALTVQKNVAALAGVADARVNFAAGTLSVLHGDDVKSDQIMRTVEASGYSATPHRTTAGATERSFWVRNRRAIATGISGVALLIGLLFEQTELRLFAGLPAAYLAYALAISIGGFHVARAGVYGLVKSHTLDMNVLMSLAVVGAVAIGEWTEGATVVFLFALGNALEGYTMDRARGAIRALMSLAPNEALVRRDGTEVSVPVESVSVGETVLVRPGDRVPVDGIVTSGGSAVNQAPITGESLPVDKQLGDEVYAGSIVEGGYVEVRASRPYSENTISRIARMVEEAQAQRAPSQRFVDQFARYYTPAVIFVAAGVATLPWLLLAQPFHEWFYRALVLLVIACPCALVISTPVSIVSAISRAARLGILIKGGAYLEEAGSLRVVAFDKTGTLTVGRPRVTDVIPLGTVPAGEVVHLAAAVESRSGHPLATAVIRRAEDEAREIKLDEQHWHQVAEFEAVAGKGVRAVVDDVTYFAGSPRYMEEAGIPIGDAENRIAGLRDAGKTVLLLGTQEGLVGLIAFADTPRPGAKASIDALKRAGIEHVVLLTGDHEATAKAIAQATGVDAFRSNLLPEDKVAAVTELKARFRKVAMVGDGVNDAPALAASTLGVAMGAAGTDAALEAADIALMSDDLGKVATAIDLSRAALATIRQNIGIALALKAVFLIATLLGFVSLWLAIAADMGASLLVTLNGMRLLAYRPRQTMAHGPHVVAPHSHGEQSRST